MSITRKCVFRRLSLLNRTKNRDESEMKKSAAPTAVRIVAVDGALMQRKIAKQFIAPLISRYRNIG